MSDGSSPAPEIFAPGIDPQAWEDAYALELMEGERDGDRQAATTYHLQLDSQSTNIVERLQESVDAVEELAKMVPNPDHGSRRTKRTAVTVEGRPTKEAQTMTPAKQKEFLEKALSGLYGNIESVFWKPLPAIIEYCLIVETLRLRRTIRFDTPPIVARMQEALLQAKAALEDETLDAQARDHVLLAMEALKHQLQILEDGAKAISPLEPL